MDGPEGMGGRRPKKDVDTTKFYKLLEVDKNAGESDIKSIQEACDQASS